MKLFFTFFFLCLSLQADVLTIYDFSSNSRHGVFDLEIEEEPFVATLDCDSFLTGLILEDKFLYLYMDECIEIYQHIKAWTDENDYGCLEVDFENKDWNLEKACLD